jgi:mannose-1-phosphate guanylyltransferase
MPIRGRALLAIWLELLGKFGVKEVLINLHAHAEIVRGFLTNGFSNVAVKISHEPQLLGSAGTLAANRDWIGSDSSFWVFYADVLTNANLGKMLQFHERHPSAATLGVCRVADPERCGIAIVDDAGRIERFVEKPKDPPGNLAFAGVLIGTQQLLDVIPQKSPADIGFDVLPQLAGKMFAYAIDDFLLDIGTLENYELAQTNWPGIS